MPRYGMVIDLKRCIGCYSCVAACKAEHNSPTGIFQTSVLEKEMGKFPNAIRLFVPVLCNHCEEPTCTNVCPTEASYKRDDGVVMIDFETCIGCGSCVEHCPYHARVLVEDNRALFFDGKTVFEKPVYEKIPVKVALKCDFCYYRLEKGLQPACVEVCPTSARIFGDLSDQEGTLQALVRKHNGWQMLPEKGTEPSVYYIG
jgi:molybdopterin-containing oxidoreductase family iron-sulfur binding subunit